jgi:phage shock protein A
MSTVIKAKISKLLDRAEDPGETLEYSYQKQMELLQNVKKGVADVVTSKKRLQLQQQKLEQQVVELDTQQASLIEKEQKMRSKIEQFRTKKEVIKAQYSAAEAQVKISEAASGVGEEMADVGLAMQRAVDKTENMRARANAMDELEAAGAFDDQLSLTAGQDEIDRELHQLTSQSAVDDDLARLKAELTGSLPPEPPQQSLEAGEQQERQA